MMMRFTIEQRHLTDASGRPARSDTSLVSFHSIEADSAAEAIVGFANEHRGEIIGEIKKFPGFHAIATVRNTEGVYTLQVTPSSQQIAPLSS